nr:2-hydroxyacid dehydrogenase [uncultured Lichenicoccus sp.]
MGPKLLQLCSLLPSTQAKLGERYDVHQWPEEPAREAWLREHAAGVRAVVTGGHQGITNALIDRLPDLGIVAINGVGYDRVDLDYAQGAGVRVTNTPDVLTDDVADLAVALMLNVMRRLPAADRHVRDGLWPSGPQKLARRASGLRYGIVGLGRIGHAIAGRLAGFGGRIAYSGPNRKQVAHDYHADVTALAAASDVLFVATAASTATRALIDGAVLAGLGPEGVLINVARGSVIDEDALVAALVDGRLGGAGLDVFADEPHVPEALLKLENVVLAPHVGSATRETREAMGNLMLDNLDAFFAGRALPTPVV